MMPSAVIPGFSAELAAFLLSAAVVLTGTPACAKQGSVPEDLKGGEARFRAHCARCHGEEAGGTAQGPPLVHKIYEPNHHGDATFLRAAQQGVRAHHWIFGNMPKIEDVTPDDVKDITRYVRWLQRQAGIQ